MRRSTFNLSHEHKLSCDMGELVPVCCEEVLPGDTFVADTSLLARVAPLANPVMHRVELRVHHWFIPNRLLWDVWEDWIVAKDETAKPTVTATSTAETELMDHLGMYPQQTTAVDALPIRAYNLVWNEFYRDQDLQTARDEDDMTLARICWEKDYFTVARLQPQQGTAFSVGLSEGSYYVADLGTGHGDVYRSDGTTASELGALASNRKAAVGAVAAVLATSGVPSSGIDSASTIDINELRQALAMQRFAEARMRFGSRYADYLRFLGVNPSDGRLDRPEYLGGGKQSVNFSEVIVTAEGTTTTPGDLYGHGIAGLRSRRYRKMFEEHGFVLSLLSARPATGYMEGQPRKFNRMDPMDYWQKELETLPWQEVYQTEIFHSATPGQVFGYVPRYEEYRHGLSYVSGTFRGGTENDYHMVREFGSAPTLNASFVECTPTDRVYSDNSMPELLINAYNRITARRLVRRTAGLGTL